MADTPRLLARPRLVQRVREGIQGRLTMLTAPAGFGKSVVLEQWAAEHHGCPVVRSTLHSDNGPPRLAPNLLTEVVADMKATGDAVVVIDGLDTPANTALVDELATLITRAPEGRHVVVAGRSRWPALVHGARLAGAVVWLDETDLAFTPDEARLLVGLIAGRELTGRQLDVLLERTEGWAVGLQLAAIALRHAADLDALVEGFSGEDRHVAGFLREEVLATQPTHVRRFLERTSVLDHLSGPLCDAVTGHSDGAGMLRHVEQHGLFTRPVAPGRNQFTYHRLVRDVLRRELHRSEPDAETRLLTRAGAWHLGRDEAEPAARYLIEAGAWEQVIELIDRYGGPMFQSGAVDTVLRWLDAVPGGRHPRRLELAVRRAYLLTMLGDTRRAEQVLHDAETHTLRPGEQLAINALRATWAFFDASPQSAIRTADVVLDAIDSVDPEEIPDVFGITSPSSLWTMATGSRARALWYLGDLAASRRTFAAVLQQRDTYPPWLVHVLSALALLEAWAGNLRVAHSHARHALTAATESDLRHHPAIMDARLALAHVSRERGHLHRADVLLDEAHAIATGTRRPITLAIHALERALWHLAAGHPDRGLAAIDQNRASGNPPPPPIIEHRRRAVEARLVLALGDTQGTRSILEADTPAGAWTADLAAAAVQASVMRRDLITARAYLDRWPAQDAEPQARLERDLWIAIVDAETGDRRRALAAGSVLVADAQAEGHVRLFLDAGRPAERLLRDLHHIAPTPYVRHILRSAKPMPHGGGGDATAELSQRELEVVRYLPTPLSSTEIAAQLYISLNTLKTHLRSIYRKLGVDGRQEAARRAMDLGIA